MKIGPDDAIWNKEICSKQTERRIEAGAFLLDILIQVLFIFLHVAL